MALRPTQIAASPPPPNASSGSALERLHRYFFYGWLFRDADTGTELERALALRHNRRQSVWLPTYLRRWCVLLAIATLAEQWAERAAPQSIVPGLLALAMVGALMVLLITAVYWAFLADPRRR